MCEWEQTNIDILAADDVGYVNVFVHEWEHTNKDVLAADDVG